MPEPVKAEGKLLLIKRKLQNRLEYG